MKTYNLFLDDFRNPIDCVNYMRDASYGTKHWITVKNYDEFVAIVKRNADNGAIPAVVSFDHDLSPEHYSDLFSNPNWQQPDHNIELTYAEYREKTGYDCAKWLIQFVEDNDITMPEIKVHSMNPVGKQNILNLFTRQKV